jgi:hypothetical protein
MGRDGAPRNETVAAPASMPNPFGPTAEMWNERVVNRRVVRVGLIG